MLNILKRSLTEVERDFAKLFSRPPDEIVCGAYIFDTPAFEKRTADIIKSAGALYEKYKGRKEEARKRARADFPRFWRETGFDCKKTSLLYEPWLENIQGENRDPHISALIERSAAEGRPFMDIASSGSMGLAPFFIKANPDMPCLISDIDPVVITDLRACIDEYLPEHRISLASFDNYDIPIKDNSLQLVTSRYGISSSCGDMADIDLYQYSVNKEKVIGEVYRILEPGGLFITLEMNRECDLDLRKLYEQRTENGPLFGIYAFDELKAVLELLKDEPWREKFSSAGFEIAAEKKYYKEYTPMQITELLHELAKKHGMANDRRERQKTGSLPHTGPDRAGEKDTGLEIYGVDSFFILRKPKK